VTVFKNNNLMTVCVCRGEGADPEDPVKQQAATRPKTADKKALGLLYERLIYAIWFFMVSLHIKAQSGSFGKSFAIVSALSPLL
jgi:hypothetical protein